MAARKKPGRPPGMKPVIIKNPMESAAPASETIKSPDIVVAPGEFYCVCCGKTYAKQHANFYRSNSPLYRGNNKYLPICISCMNNLFNQYADLLGSEEDAVDRLCQKFDIYFSDQAFKKSEVPRIGQSSRMGEYVKLINTNKIFANKTYDAYLAENTDERVISAEDAEPDEIDPEIIERFGLGYSKPEYKRMDKQYGKITAEAEGSDDPNFTELIKTLCTTQILRDRAIAKNDLDAYDKATRLYQSTLKSIQWKPDVQKGESYDDANDSFGQWRAQIEQYCPSIVYKDRDLYRDVDDYESYWKRFIVRPFKNFFTGSNDQDDEFSVEPRGSGEGDRK